MTQSTDSKRRKFLAGALSAAALAASPVSTRGRILGPRADREAKNIVHDLNLTAAARVLRRGDVAAEDYARALLERADRFVWLNAFIRQDRDAVLAAARAADKARKAGARLGPLHGVPVAVKDNIETTALTTTAGTAALRSFRPGRDAPVVQRLFAAGAILLGKTNMHELAIGATSNNHTFGAVHNPYRRGYHPGGSSGGTAAAVAARLCPAGLGSDTAGSVRMPASLCGLVGLRPATGRYPGAGVVPLSVMRDTVGPMARGVADAALLDGLLSGRPVKFSRRDLKGVRIGVPRPWFWEHLDPGTERVAARALDHLKAAGAILVEAPMDEIVALNRQLGVAVILFEAMRDLPRYLAESGAGVSMEELIAGVTTPNVKRFFAQATGADAPTPTVYAKAVKVARPALQRAYGDYFRDHRLATAVYPTTPLASRPIDPNDMVAYQGQRVYARVYLRNIDASANAGLPSISLPAGVTEDGLPVGVEFVVPFGAERAMFEIAAAFERVIGGLPSPPEPS